MKFIDTHAHSYLLNIKYDQSNITKNIQFKNVEHVILPNIDNTTTKALVDLWQSDKDFFSAMMGLHPGSVKEKWKKELKEIEKALSQHSYSAIGEIGLDYYWDTTFTSEQKEAFILQIAWAKEHNLPIAIHCREAFDDVLDILAKEQNGSLKGVLHCFTGNLEQAQKLIDLNFKLGIGGVLTYKKSGLDQTVEQIPLKHLLLETDAPYLSPVPFRGKPNKSAYIKYVAQKLAEICNTSIAEVCNVTTQNAKELFNLNF